MSEEGEFIANSVKVKILEKNRRRPLTVVLKFKLSFLGCKTCGLDSCQLLSHCSSPQQRQRPEAKNWGSSWWHLCIKSCEFNCLSVYTGLAPPKTPIQPAILFFFFSCFKRCLLSDLGDAFCSISSTSGMPSVAAWKTECRKPFSSAGRGLKVKNMPKK